MFACTPLRRQYAHVLNLFPDTFCLEEANVDGRPGSACTTTLSAAPKIALEFEFVDNCWGFIVQENWVR